MKPQQMSTPWHSPSPPLHFLCLGLWQRFSPALKSCLCPEVPLLPGHGVTQPGHPCTPHRGPSPWEPCAGLSVWNLPQS